ncbi:hypothetical protein DSO57_1015025 [Entomophthora muscae]|nr:hypothetical protein DSO57_1015025 [Entomophthora muscae]
MSSTRVPKVFQELVSRVMRSFYEDRHVIVMSLLNKVEWMRDEDLADKLVIPTKDLHKICGKLREEGYLHIFSRTDTKSGGSRPVPRTYYAIDYAKFINAAKYKMHEIWKRLQDSMDKVKQQRGYMCPKCEKVVAQLEAFDCTDPASGMFICPKCRITLVVEPENPEKYNSQEKSARLMAQAKPIFTLLKQTDNMEFKVTKDTITRAMNKREQAQKSAASGELAYSQDTGGNITIISVNFLENDRASKEQKEAELEKKRQQNAMPIWFLKSTIQPLNKSKRRSKKAREAELPILQQPEEDKIKLEKQLEEENKRYEYYKNFYHELNKVASYNLGEDPNQVPPISSPSRKRPLPIDMPSDDSKR